MSLKAAAELYGVVLDPETLAIDHATTERLRTALRSAEREKEAASSS